MEDLNSTLSSILGDPQKMEQLRQVAQSLGIDTGAQAQQTFQQQPLQQQTQQPQQNFQQQPAQTYQTEQRQPQQAQQVFQPQPQAQQPFQPQSQSPFPSQSGAAGGFNPAAFAGIAEVMKTFNQSDKNVDLLRTLKPHFSPERAGKIDDAVRIMQLIRAWPALRDSGMLGSLGNMFGGGAK